jgi:hypothetical protein
MLNARTGARLITRPKAAVFGALGLYPSDRDGVLTVRVRVVEVD